MNRRRARWGQTRPGQSTVEFALMSVVLLGLIFVIIDLARAGFAQHGLDNGTGDLARSLATISAANISSDPNGYTPTPLNPASSGNTTYLGQTVPISTAIQQAVTRASALSSGAFSAAPLTLTGPMTLTNGQVTVVATPDLTSTAQLTVTVTVPFTPAVGLFLGGHVFHLQGRETTFPLIGQ